MQNDEMEHGDGNEQNNILLRQQLGNVVLEDSDMEKDRTAKQASH